MVHFRGVTEGTEERHACTVRAVSTAAEIPYADAHALLAACGRRRGHKFNFRGFMSGRYKLGSYSVTAVCMPLVSPTLAQVVKDFPRGTFIVRKRGHVFTVRDGIVYDADPQGARTRIKNIWHLTKE